MNKEILIVSTLKENVITNLEGDFSNLQNCNHEEADTRIFLHLVDAITRSEAGTFLIRTVDTDVVVLSVYAASIYPLTKIYVAFGKGSSFRYIASHAIASTLGYEKCQCLPLFHSFTGCDTTSYFVGKGKKTCWQIWDKYPDISNIFLKIMLGGELESNDIEIIERYVVLIYDKTNNSYSVNQCRFELFSVSNRNIENIPPTAAALLQHTKRSIFQANIWHQIFKKYIDYPNPNNFGWKETDSEFIPVWSELPEVLESCRQLVSCGCKKGCTSRCKCKKENLPCSHMCKCLGKCEVKN